MLIGEKWLGIGVRPLISGLTRCTMGTGGLYLLVETSLIFIFSVVWLSFQFY